ncbi:hypothetical protein B0A55_00693 [Friedmanniomyces simplex]|uniref:Pentatricopeptide repeat domain-containing protein n=1 Tax=Friedmanniomyces simplex TaxID=329884 RepID=A0A4U0Y3W2_9PEZI|nr:hypothetical protein B0A55_04548 [Friedmanniomyces simplex]TKA83168.1 hypothetical protein B0A55_00693 [Friedmanniomyces simplex]
MQTLWSRVAQTRGTCCCPQCIHSVHGVGRRATASATQRIPKYLTSSTLFYSGVFAAAATWDAGAKKQRREEWDRAIADVKLELGQAAEDGARDRRDEDRTTEATIPYAPDVFEDVAPLKRRSRWPTNTGPELKIHRLPPESIYATGERKTRSELRRWSPKKLETVMLSVDAMQLQIFIEMQGDNNRKMRQAASAAVPIEYRDKMFLSVPELKAALFCKLEDVTRISAADPGLSGWKRSPDDVPLSSYRQDDHGTFHDTARQLNSCLQDLFRRRRHETNSSPSLLAKIAYNLSISSAPPNIDTYNTLLLGLSEVKQYRVIDRVIWSLRRTHVRPNEVTNAAVLSHLTATDNTAGFVRWVELMRGKHNGLALARPDIHINEAGAGRLLRVKREDKEDKVIQLPYPTPNVFGALIKGVLKFSGFDTALGICEGMGHEGWGLCLSGLTPLLTHCADNGDWDSGLAIWGQIQALKSRSLQRYAKQRSEVEKVPLEAFAAMVRLCSKAGQRGVFEDVWAQAMRADVQAARALVRLVKAQNEAAARAWDDRPIAGSIGDHQQSDDRVDGAGTIDHAAVEFDAPDVRSPNDEREEMKAGSVLRELRTLQTSTARDERRPPRQQQTPVTSQNTSPKPTVLLREELDGLLPASHELEDYEMRERPMTMYG